ncbi:MAG TPA: uracil-DNA glycosylase [Gemmatimonadaceae bacterium]|nr:uracil-DNA glycosylase [Gemmatimonadaceae bacterium]
MGIEDRLRRYLEQRRELGESELVLDSMSVDEVMRIIGALGGGGVGGPDSARVEGEPAPATARRESERQVESSERNGIDIPETADWREALRAAGAGEPSARAARQGRAGDAEAGTGGNKQERREATEPEAPRAGTEPEPQRAAIDAPQGIVVGERFDDEPVPEIAACRTLEEIATLVARCQRCDLYRTALNPVPGEGNPNARLMCIGEAPGAKEDETGRPFVGAAGELLTKILAAINLRRDEVFIANVLKHRPPGNRNPLPAEVTACSPYLVRQVALIRPKVIITFGAFAAQTLLDTKLAIGKLRGAVHRYHGIPVVVTYHPAALLRNPAWKRPTWEDVQLARRILDKSAA